VGERLPEPRVGEGAEPALLAMVQRVLVGAEGMRGEYFAQAMKHERSARCRVFELGKDRRNCPIEPRGRRQASPMDHEWTGKRPRPWVRRASVEHPADGEEHGRLGRAVGSGSGQRIRDVRDRHATGALVPVGSEPVVSPIAGQQSVADPGDEGLPA
jgi:hypothetical protein